MRPTLLVTVLACTAPAIVAAASPEKWVGTADSNNGSSLKIVIKDPAAVQSDGSAQLTGHFRCTGKCLARHRTASVNLSNTADGVGHKTVEINLPHGTVCSSDEDLDGPLDALPPSVGTELVVQYECDDTNGNPVDTGSMDITRRR